MSGRVLLVAPVRDFNFTYMGDNGVGACTVASQIDASQWTECVLEVNILSSDVAGTAKIEVQLVEDGYTPSQPDRPNLGDTIGTPLTIDANTTNTFVSTTYTTGITSKVAVQVVGTQPATAVTCTATLEIRLTFKAS